MDLSAISQLHTIMAKLRHPDNGCPWDLEQNFSTIAPYTIEEAYEVADAIASGDKHALKEELGDLLLQVVFHAQMAEEEGSFTFNDVAETICEKMIRRHPHVFSNVEIKDAKAQTENWEQLKAAERKTKNASNSVLSDVPSALPALMRAEKLQKRAARVGFDWDDVSGVIAKIHEELAEVEEAMKESPEKIAEEIGDLLFAVTNLARFASIDPEEALRQTNRKFIRRFTHIESSLQAQNKSWESTSLNEMETLWNEAKTLENPKENAA